MTKHNTITIVPFGGLANRMKAIAAGIRLARECGSRLDILWTRDHGLNSRFDQLFQPVAVDGTDVSIIEANTVDLITRDRPRPKNLFLPRLFLWLKRTAYMSGRRNGELFHSGTFDFTAWAKGRNVWMASCVYFMEATPPSDAFDIFRPLAHIQNEIDTRATTFAADTVGIHVRRTDNARSRNQSRTEDFLECMALMPATTRFFLATDEEEIKTIFRKEFGNRLTCMTEKARRDTAGGIRNAVTEMYLLARTRLIIGSHGSTFSMTPAAMGRIPLLFADKTLADSLAPARTDRQKILTIIVSYNFMPWLHRTISSLLQSTAPTDIMVIDNASTDETTAVIRRDYPQVILVENGANLGFGRANNTGMRYAMENGYDSVLLLNQDAWIAADTLGRLADMSRRHPRYGVLSPIHLTGKGDSIEHGFAVYSNVKDIGRQPETVLAEVPFIDAAIWFMPVNVLRRVGLFAPIFYHYGEDKDMANRLRKHHYRIGFMPRTYGYHDREFRKTGRKGFLRAEWVYHLSEYANINYSYRKAYAMGVLALVKKAGGALLGGRLHDAADYAAMACRLHNMAGQVKRARHQAENVNLNDYM